LFFLFFESLQIDFFVHRKDVGSGASSSTSYVRPDPGRFLENPNSALAKKMIRTELNWHDEVMMNAHNPHAAEKFDKALAVENSMVPPALFLDLRVKDENGQQCTVM